MSTNSVTRLPPCPVMPYVCGCRRVCRSRWPYPYISRCVYALILIPHVIRTMHRTIDNRTDYQSQSREINGYRDTKLNIHEPMNNSLALYKAGRMSRDRWGACVGGGVIMAHGYTNTSIMPLRCPSACFISTSSSFAGSISPSGAAPSFNSMLSLCTDLLSTSDAAP